MFFMCDGEGGERLLDGLLVADVRQHCRRRRRWRCRRPPECAGRTPPSASRRPMVLSVTVLPPVFGPVMTSVSKSEPSRSETGTTFFRSISGCRARTSSRLAVRADLRLHAVHLDATGCARAKMQSSCTSISIAVADALAERGRLGRQLRPECVRSPFALADQQLTQGVVRIDGGHRLDEERAARSRTHRGPDREFRSCTRS